MFNQKNLFFISLFTLFLAASAKSEPFIAVHLKPSWATGLMQMEGQHYKEISFSPNEKGKSSPIVSQTREQCESSLVSMSQNMNALYKKTGSPIVWNQEVDSRGKTSISLRHSNGVINALVICVEVTL